VQSTFFFFGLEWLIAIVGMPQRKIVVNHREASLDWRIHCDERHSPFAMKQDATGHSQHTGDPPRVLARLPTVLKMTGLGRSTIYRWIANGSFPSPVRLGPRAVAWRWSDLDRWTQSRSSTHH
jgi:prophage regulatory protein